MIPGRSDPSGTSLAHQRKSCAGCPSAYKGAGHGSGMTSSAEKLLLFAELIVASGFIGVIVFLGLVWLARRVRSFRGCLRCGCELQNTGGQCLMCSDPLRRPRSLPRGGGSATETVGEPRRAVESPSYP